MLIIRRFKRNDALEVGRLIANTYSAFNLSFTSDEDRKKYLGPFQYAESSSKLKQKSIVDAIKADIVLVAQDGENIVGVLRGKMNKLQSLFVSGDFQRKGIGKRLVMKFENISISQKIDFIKLMSTLYAIPFYQAMGYKRTTGIRRMKSFEGEGFLYQPMKKILKKERI